jgi:hypothetical protein
VPDKGIWQRIDTRIPLPTGTPEGERLGIRAFAVDPKNPNRLYASLAVQNKGTEMFCSPDGGMTWRPDKQLTELMVGSGRFLDRSADYPQPTLVAFDPENPNVIVAGARDAGVYLSLDSGKSWSVLTDPFDSHITGIPHLPRPYYAYFDHEGGVLNIYIGTIGRGVWRIRMLDVAVPASFKLPLPCDIPPKLQLCDIDGDSDVDRTDIEAIVAARNTPAGTGDPRDVDGDGTITVNDARRCTLLYAKVHKSEMCTLR